MDDRYLFRGKRIKDNKWFCGHYYQDAHLNALEKLSTSHYIVGLVENEQRSVRFMVDEDTICQCTGLKDKNGKLIYERDIVKNNIAIGVVRFGNPDFHKGSICSMFYWQMIKQLDHEHFCFKDDVFTEFKDVEVMGNIYENPELMKK